MLDSAQEIIDYIANAKKKTPVKVYVKGHDLPDTDTVHCFGDEKSRVLIGELEDVKAYLEENKVFPFGIITDTNLEEHTELKEDTRVNMQETLYQALFNSLISIPIHQ